MHIRGCVCGNRAGDRPVIGNTIQSCGVFDVVDAAGKLLLNGNSKTLYGLLKLGNLALHFQNFGMLIAQAVL